MFWKTEVLMSIGAGVVEVDGTPSVVEEASDTVLVGGGTSTPSVDEGEIDGSVDESAGTISSANATEKKRGSHDDGELEDDVLSGGGDGGEGGGVGGGEAGGDGCDPSDAVEDVVSASPVVVAGVVVAAASFVAAVVVAGGAVAVVVVAGPAETTGVVEVATTSSLVVAVSVAAFSPARKSPMSVLELLDANERSLPGVVVAVIVVVADSPASTVVVAIDVSRGPEPSATVAAAALVVALKPASDEDASRRSSVPLASLTLASVLVAVDEPMDPASTPPSPMIAVPLPLPPPAPTDGASGNATYHESTSVADWKFLFSRSAIFVSPEKLPQNICAELVENTAEFSPVNEDPGEPGERSGFPRAFATFSQLPRHDEG